GHPAAAYFYYAGDDCRGTGFFGLGRQGRLICSVRYFPVVTRWLSRAVSDLFIQRYYTIRSCKTLSYSCRNLPKTATSSSLLFEFKQLDEVIACLQLIAGSRGD